jgi:ATP-dependent Clp protease adaptor protein ClpS
MNTITAPHQAEETDVLEATEPVHRLIVHNDNFNTFGWVILTLMQVCQHDELQAEQCAYFIHRKGKWSVAHGEFEKVKLMQEQIISRGINATVESN